MTLALQLLTFNDSEFLSHCLESLAKQTDGDWELWTRDQSTDDTHVGRVKNTLDSFKENISIHSEAGDNLGFAGGHQKLFAMHNADLVLLVNVDTVLSPDFVLKIKQAFENNDKLGAATGAIYRWSLDDDKVNLSSDIDSLGLQRRLTEQVYDLRSEDNEKEKTMNTFGVSGCLPMYRRSAVKGTDPEGRLFDPAYHCYKEDVDVAYRLRAGGWEHDILHDAIAHHHRTFKPGSRPQVSLWAQRQSYRNHLWNLIVHMGWKDWLMRGWIIIPYEVAKSVFLISRSPKDVIRALRETWNYLPSLRARKRALMSLYAK